jgi:hypothetical protein
MEKIVRIGSGSGFFLDSALSMQQLLSCDPLPQYIIFDHMAEGMMSQYLQQAQQSSEMGFSTQFIDHHVMPHLAKVMAGGVKLISNAGGLNPLAAARALEKRAAELNLFPKIGVVTGDDLRDRFGDLAAQGYRDMFTGESWPKKMLAGNAYFGGFPIAEALRRGADIVITGRVVDSGLALGALIHEFGWKPTDYDRLAAGTAIGHLLECGTQSTGGTFTDWLEIPDSENMGFPIAECRSDGSFVLTKPEGTGGLVTVGTVSEQLLYEVSDPGAYLVPDVACDFTTIKLREIAPNRVEASQTTGRAPSGSYKVCSIVDDGWKVIANHTILGVNAAAKARRTADNLLARTRRLTDAAGLPPPKATSIHVLGAGETFAVGPTANADTTEAMMRLVYVTDDVRAAQMFFAETFSPWTNGSPGSLAVGVPAAMAPVHRLFSFLLPRDKLAPTVTVGSDSITMPAETSRPAPEAKRAKPEVNAQSGGGDASVPLIALAWGRSGDKGNLYNVGVIARRVEYLPHIRAALTEEKVAAWMAHTFDNPAKPDVKRYEVPGINALNFVMNEALRGGSATGLSVDASSKGMAQKLLQMPIPVPRELARRWDGARLT